MNTTKPLPEKLEPFRQQIIPLHAEKLNLDKQIEANNMKLRDAQTERDELRHSDPNDDANVRKLAEAQVRFQLFENHGEKLNARIAASMMQAAQVTAAFSRELRKIAAEVERVGRERFIAAVCQLSANRPVEVEASLGNPFALLRSREEQLAHVLRHEAEYEQRDGNDPFQAFDDMANASIEFCTAYEQAQAAKREPLPA